jgi:hypothetical protein
VNVRRDELFEWKMEERLCILLYVDELKNLLGGAHKKTNIFRGSREQVDG